MRRLAIPRSIAENERPIVRKQYRFDDGMRMAPDCEGLDVGDNTSNPRAVAWLNNCRGYKTNIEGDPGTVRFVAAAFAVTITDNAESYETALLEGELFTANGEEELAEEVVFEVCGVGDFTGDTLAGIKGDSVRPYDHFRYNTAVTPPFEYLGNCRIPAVPGLGDTSATEFSATKSGDRIMRSGGPLFTSDIVGSYFVWDYGKRDLILEYIDSNTLRCSVAETSRTGTMCRIEPEVYASHMHRARQTWVILAGNRLYASTGIPAAGWTEIPVVADTAPSPVVSLIREDGDNLILMNNAGWFRVMLSSYLWAYRLNESAPDRCTPDTLSGGYACQYRIIFTMALITGFDSLHKNRFDNDAQLNHESSPVVRDDTVGRDYGITQTNTSADSNGYIEVAECFYPIGARHFTHYSLYSTLDVSQNGVDSGNKDNQFIYAADIPVAKGLRITVSNTGLVTVMGGVLTAADESDYLHIAGAGTYIVVQIHEVAGRVVAQLYNMDWSTYDGGVLPLSYAGIGGGEVLRVSIAENVLTVLSGRGLTDYDNGKFLFGEQDAYPIRRVLSETTAEMVWSSDVDDMAAVIDPISRHPHIPVTDATLKSRRDAASSEAADYYLQTRFYKPLPNCSTFTIESGWMVGAKSGDHVYYYCDLARMQHAGYYKETKQYNTKIVAAITQIVGYSGAIYIRCRNSTHKILLSVPVEVGDAASGEQCSQLPDPIEVDPIIGVISQFDSVRFPRGGEIVLTSEPYFRFFDGEKYGEPYDVDRVNKAMVRKFKRPVVMSYVPRRGLIVWGRCDNA